MKAFTIDETNRITIYATAAEAKAVANSEYFGSEAALAKLAAGWPAARLVEIHNSLTGVTPVKRFKDRPTAVSRIWKSIQSLGDALSPQSEVTGPVAPHTPDVALETAPATNDAGAPTNAPATASDEKLMRALSRAFAGLSPEAVEAKWDALKIALVTLPQAEAHKPTTSGAPREGSKISQVITMLKREGGVTLSEIMSAMSWQRHTTVALLSAGGSLAKKHGLAIVSEKVGDQRTYSIKD